ncbi:MAG: polysaccharide deacetylase family protein [Candidatus Omnitrophica bacterium]|nr:polysaccharide deacetylase family protein [Candidatus Omnitrophota bacterium]
MIQTLKQFVPSAAKPRIKGALNDFKAQRIAAGQAASAEKVCGLKILMYHRIKAQVDDFDRVLSVPAAQFEKQMAYLKRWYEPMPLQKLIPLWQEGKATLRQIGITFDDGYEDNLQVAAPILNKYGIPATVFVTSGCMQRQEALWTDQVRYLFKHTARTRYEIDLGGRRWKFKMGTLEERYQSSKVFLGQLKKSPNELCRRTLEKFWLDMGVPMQTVWEEAKILNWNQVRDLHKLGITIGAHTVNHPPLSKMRVGDAAWEIRESKRVLESCIQEPVNEFAYPFGEMDQIGEHAPTLVHEAGFPWALAVLEKDNPPGTDPYLIGRRYAGPWDTLRFSEALLWKPREESQ